MKRARTEDAKKMRQSELMKAALDEFFEKGFSAARTEDIARRAGLSKGTLYLYFNSKSDLFMAIIDNLAGKQLAKIERLSEVTGSLEEMLRVFVQIFPTIIGEGDMPRLVKVLIGDSQAFPDIIETYKTKILDRMFEALTNLLIRAHKQGEINVERADLVSRLIEAPFAMSGLWEVVFSDVESQSLDLEALFQIHADILMKALKA